MDNEDEFLILREAFEFLCDDGEDEIIAAYWLWSRQCVNYLSTFVNHHGESLPGRKPNKNRDFKSGYERLMLD